LGVSACAVPASQPPASPPNPVLAFVATAQIGQSATITLPNSGGTVNVLVESQYFAASGGPCRHYQIDGAEALACQDGGSWQTIPPLITP